MDSRAGRREIDSLVITEFHGGRVEQYGERHWRLSIPPGPSGEYRWAQLDDYRPYPRSQFFWRPPVRIGLQARVSGAQLAGTWGFGLWNDPFTMSMVVAGSTRKIPALPNAAWYFYASPPNYLAFRDNHPAQGLLAASFSSLRVPTLLLAPGALALPLLLWRPAARLLRRLVRILVREDAGQLKIDPQDWHSYGLEWHSDRIRYFLDDSLAAETRVSPRGPLGFVLWIDNQYAAFTPAGEVRFGNLPTGEEQWLEVRDLHIEPI